MGKTGFTEAEKKSILATIHLYFPDCKILFFGSRKRGDFKEHSDLDLCLKGDSPLNLSKLAALKEAFTESSLLYKVDLSDWHRVTEEFQKLIEGESEVWS